MNRYLIKVTFADNTTLKIAIFSSKEPKQALRDYEEKLDRQYNKDWKECKISKIK